MQLPQAPPEKTTLSFHGLLGDMTNYSPPTEWGSARRLLARYLEITGKDPAIIDEIYN